MSLVSAFFQVFVNRKELKIMHLHMHLGRVKLAHKSSLKSLEVKAIAL